MDDGYTGTNANRPHLTRLLADARAKAFEVVLAYSGDRIARDAYLKEGIKRELRKNKVRLEYVNATFEDNPMGVAFEQIAGVMEQLDKATILARMNGGRYAKARKGLVVSPGNSPYGWEPDPEHPGKLRILESEAEIIRLIFSLCVDEGVSVYGIIRELDRRAIRPRSGDWAYSLVLKILSMERYVGTAYFGQTQIVEGERHRGKEIIAIPIPAIVTPERREAALAQLRRNRSALVGRPANYTYLLTGLLRCGACGLRYESSPNHGKRAYRHRKSKTCSGPFLTAHSAEEGVWETLYNAFHKPRCAPTRRECPRGRTRCRLR